MVIGVATNMNSATSSLRVTGVLLCRLNYSTDVTRTELTLSAAIPAGLRRCPRKLLSPVSLQVLISVKVLLNSSRLVMTVLSSGGSGVPT